MSFVRKSRKVTVGEPGKYGLNLVRSGVLDSVLSGGFVLGTMTVFEEDSLAEHYIQCLRCIMSTDTVLVYDPEAVEWASLTPNIVKHDNSTAAADATEEMKIAFRYSNLTSNRETYDISKTLTRLDDVTTFPPEPSYATFAAKILDDIQNSMSGDSDNGIRKIILKGFGGLLWPEATTSELYGFLRDLRRLSRGLNGIVILTVPPSQVSETVRTMITQVSDL
jgi:hypothetical protein